MATESTRKHRPTIDDIRSAHADAAAVVRSYGTRPARNLAEDLDQARAIIMEYTLRWVIGGYAPGKPLGLEDVEAQATALRAEAAPQTDAEVFGGLAS